jgi:hypothetical protein
MAVVLRSDGKASTRMERVRGAITAAPTPWRARKTISSGSSRERAQAAEKRVKMARPVRKSRLRPKRSPSVPPVRISDARART